MNKRFINLIKNHAERITKRVVQEIQTREETRHYREIPENVTEDRIAQVIHNVHSRLGNWLNKKESKTELFSYYSDLGAHRCKEGIPVDEVVMAFMLIKRSIWHELRDQIMMDSGFTLNQIMEVNYYVNLNHFMEINYYVNIFFDQIIHALVNGYQEELGKVLEKDGKENQLLAKIFKK